MIDRDIKRAMGQMVTSVQVVASTHDGVTGGYCSHWVSQVSFEEPVVLASISPKHDTHPLIEAAGWFTVSLLSGDQVEVGQYFSYPGRKFKKFATEMLEFDDGNPFVPGCLAWFRAEITEKLPTDLDHDLFLARVTTVGEGRLGADPLLYAARHGWKRGGGPAREPGESVRDKLIARLDAAIEAGQVPPDSSASN